MQAIFNKDIILIIVITLLIVIGLLVYIAILHYKIHIARHAIKKMADAEPDK